tara:strand:- start:13880 stop:14101 length:222 start_codon:yes stop_codon:yes gene_type:complete
MKKIFLPVILFTIFIYQKLLSPLTPPSCKFSPTCSNYAIDAFKKHPLLKAFNLILLRILKCHPWSKGGYDPVK